MDAQPLPIPPPLVRFLPGDIDLLDRSELPESVISDLKPQSQTLLWIKIEAPDIPSLFEYQAIADQYEQINKIPFTKYIEALAIAVAREKGIDYPIVIISLYFQKGELIIFGGRSVYIGDRFIVASGFGNSSFVSKKSPEQVVNRIKSYLKERFKKISFSNPSPTLLIAEIYTENLFKRPWVKIDLAIIVSRKGDASMITVLAIAYGERGIKAPSMYDDQINAGDVTIWVTQRLIPALSGKL